MADTFADVRAEMEQIGAIYRKIQDRYGDDISIIYLDPRNHFSIAAYLLKHWKRGSLSLRGLFKSLVFGIHRGAFFYNGCWINPDKELEAEGILRKIDFMHTKGEQ